MYLLEEADLEMMKYSIVEYFEGIEGWDEERVNSMAVDEIVDLYRQLFID